MHPIMALCLWSLFVQKTVQSAMLPTEPAPASNQPRSED